MMKSTIEKKDKAAHETTKSSTLLRRPDASTLLKRTHPNAEHYSIATAGLYPPKIRFLLGEL